MKLISLFNISFINLFYGENLLTIKNIIMKAICTSYNKTDKGLLLRNNWDIKIENDEHLRDFISRFVEEDGVNFHLENSRNLISRRGYSAIIEGKMELDNIVIHIRIIN